MKVCVRGLEKTSTLYIYGEGDDEVTEQFVAKFGTRSGECDFVNDETISSVVNKDVDWTDVKFIMAENIFNKYATMLERVQEVYDQLNDTALEHNMTVDELYQYMIDNGIIDEKECKTFFYK